MKILVPQHGNYFALCVILHALRVRGKIWNTKPQRTTKSSMN